MSWNPEKSKAKAKRATLNAGGMGLLTAALLLVLRIVLGDKMPVSEDQEGALIGHIVELLVMFGVVTGGVAAKTYTDDKAAHGGTTDNAGSMYWPATFALWILIVAVGFAFALSTSGCTTTTGENGEVVICWDAESLAPLLRESFPDLAEALSNAIIAVEQARTDNDIREANAEFERVIAALQEAGAIFKVSADKYCVAK